jgi:hypothetical protein
VSLGGSRELSKNYGTLGGILGGLEWNRRAHYYHEELDDDLLFVVGPEADTELDAVCCYADGVRWSACLEHADVGFSTEELTLTRLRQLAEDRR